MKRALNLFLTIIFILPFVFFLVLSFASEYYYPEMFPANLTISHFVQMIQTDSSILECLFTSLIISLSTACLSTLFGFIVSKSLAYHSKKKLFQMICYLPFAFSPVIFAYCLNYFFNSFDLSGNAFGIILAQFIVTFPFALILFMNHWSVNLKASEQLVYTLGGSVWQTYKLILIPMSKSIIIICFFQTFLISWFDYGLTSVIGLSKVQTLTIRMYQYINESNIYFAALGSCLLIFPPIILLWMNKNMVFKT
ncbi:MAG: ABC transporter permease [Saprospiraceae bacterium]